MPIRIEKYNEKDQPALAELVKLAHEEDYILNILNSPSLKCAYSAFKDETLVGVLFAWTSSFHPHCVYFRIMVNPLFQGLNIEEKLLFKLEEIDTDLPLQTSIWETVIGTKEFLECNGFHLMRKTYMPALHISDATEFGKITDVNGDIKTLAEIVTDDYLLNQLTKLVKRNYEDTHGDNPVAEMELNKWKQLFLEDDTVMQGSYIRFAPNEKDILAYSLLHESEAADTLELGWCGSSSADNMASIPQLILHQIQYADKHGYSFLEGEFDTTSEYAMEVLRTIPFPPCASWNTYQK